MDCGFLIDMMVCLQRQSVNLPAADRFTPQLLTRIFPFRFSFSQHSQRTRR